MIKEDVFHIKWGNGVFLSETKETITVIFNGQGEKKFDKKTVFEKGLLKFINPKKQESFINKLKQSKIVTKEEGTFKLIPEEKSNQKLKKESSEATISDMKIGEKYTNQDLCVAFLVSNQGGMRKSNKTNSLVLISHHSSEPERNPYEDKWIDGKFHYTGMGLRGDQSLEVSQNKTLAQSHSNDVNIYLFESYANNEYIYQGQVILADSPYPIREKDSDGKLRRVYKFPLAVIR